MTIPAADIVKVTWTSTGTSSPIILGGAVTGFNAFPAALDGLEVTYSIEHTTAPERETGTGVYTHSGTTLTRARVSASTSGGALVSFSPGTKHVRIVAIARDVYENRATVDPTTQGRSQGYIAGRSRWLNTSTDTVWICLNDDDISSPMTATWGQMATTPDLGVLATLDVTLPADANQSLDGTGVFSAKFPAQVSGGEITAGTGTAIRSWSPADVVSAIDQHAPVGGGGGGLTTELDAGTALTIGAGTASEHHVMTSDSAITITLDAQGTVGTESAITRAGSGVITVQMEAGAGYWTPGSDIGGTAATTSFTAGGYCYFICIRNTGGNAAEWLIVGQTSLSATSDGALTVTGNLDVNNPATFDDNITMDGSAKSLDFGGNTAFGNLAKVETDSGTLGIGQSGQIIVTSGNITIPTTAGFNCTLIAGGAHTVTFNATTSAAMATGDVMSIAVQSSTVIHAVRTTAANKVSFT